MKLTVLMLTVCLSGVFASTYAQTATLNVSAKNETLENVLKQIEKQSEFLFFYNLEDINKDVKISVNAKEANIQTVLDVIAKQTGLKYTIRDRHIVLTKSVESEVVNEPIVTKVAQTKRKVTGVVKDVSDTPIVGANVVEKGTTNGTVTDAEGRFSIEVSTDPTLVVSYIGYVDYQIKLQADQNSLNIILKENSEMLDEVVVTALGIKRSEKALGYATQKVEGEELNIVKNVDVTSGLIGKVAGLKISSSTEFNVAPSLSLRGESPLLVIDGVPYTNISLRDIASDDVEEMNVLKGATASALYGSRGGNGAIIITTKKGNDKGGLSVSVNSSTMFDAGFVAFPDVQTSYSSGAAGQYRTGDYVWGARLDAGYTALQYNPFTYEWEERELLSVGKNNLNNFLERSVVTNNNISISHQGEKGNFRTSFTHVYNKGQYPNNKLNKLTFFLGGDINVGKFSFEGNISYNKRFYPNNSGTGYGKGGYMYNMVIWTGTEYDIRDYRNYWVAGKENIQQNWMDNAYYDNPYFISYGCLNSDDYDVTNGFMSMKYDVLPWLNITLRSGFDYYSDRLEYKYAQSAIVHKTGYYKVEQSSAFSVNNDLLIMGNYKFGKLGIDGLLGGTINYRQNSNVYGETQNGISIPGFYSLNASVDPARTGQGFSKKQVNSIYGKLSLSWESMLFVDVTARNDWSSTLPSSTRSYFYPSVTGSLILSEIIDLPDWVNLWKVRGSWTKTKNDLGIYDTNNVYSISTNVWNGLSAAYYPSTIRGVDLLPESSRSYEIGMAANFLQNRLWGDITYYNKVYYDAAVQASISSASGFSSTYVNSEEEIERRGVEITLGGVPVKTHDFEWTSMFNWSLDRRYYKKLDPLYSSKYPWVKEGARVDAVTSGYMWDTDPEGNIVHGSNGLPVSISEAQLMGYSTPDWIWGFTNTFKYKNFTLNVSIDGCVGGVMYNRLEQSMWHSGTHIGTDNQWRYDEVVNGKINYIGKGVKVVSGTIERDEFGQVISDNRVYAPNDIPVSYESYIRNYHGGCYSGYPQNYFSKTYIKLREVALNYKVPSKIAQKMGMNNLQIGFVGNNLFLWTKEFNHSDPDSDTENLNSPSMRYLGFNVKFDF